MLDVQWAAMADGHFAPLDRVVLSHVDAQGVFIIWHGGPRPRTVCVGQGAPVAVPIERLRQDPDVRAYERNGLFVTWAAIPPEHRDGVERYLVEALRPLVRDRFPGAHRIPVSLPWAA